MAKLQPRSRIGFTYKVRDDDLPHKNGGSGKIVDLAIIEDNGKRLAGVRTTTRQNKNAKPFKTKHRLYKGYKTFLEDKFQNGDFIVPNDERLSENPWKNNLSKENVDEVRDTIYYHSRQSIENRKKRDRLKNEKNRH